IFFFMQVSFGDMTVNAIKLSYTGEEGWELYLPKEQTGKLYEHLLDAGESLGLVDFGTHTLNWLRLEKGFRGWGSEMDAETTMVMAGLESFIDMKKGDFHGRDAVVQQLARLPSKRLVQIAFDSPRLDPVGDEAVWANDSVVGTSTSGGYSPVLGKSLAFCYLPPLLCYPGSSVQIQILDELLPATVLAGPPEQTYIQRRKK
ncbi:Glycine cleavage T-protein-like N-terminal, partial [Trinorchestia longiramus]